MDNLNNNCIAQNAFIITFNIVNVFARIHIESGIKVSSAYLMLDVLQIHLIYVFLEFCVMFGMEYFYI